MFHNNQIIEIRGHARGGQGMVTAFEILAAIFSKAGDYEVQAFPFFGVERTGAPIQAFLRISKNPIQNRSNIYNPHLVVLFDEGLLDQVPVFDGLHPDGAALVNTEKPVNEIPRLPGGLKTLFTVPATSISIEKKLGSKALPIVNSAMIGAVIRILDGDISISKEIIRDEVPVKHEENAMAAEQSYNSLQEHNLTPLKQEPAKVTAPVVNSPDEVPFAPYWSKPLSLNKTGNWRVFAPQYVNRTPPCTHYCPAGTDVRQFVKLTAERKFAEAFETIYKHNPFPATCGRVCPHFCQQNCNREGFDDHVNIGAIERFLGDFSFDLKRKPVPVTRKEKIGVAGSGPAGLTAAIRLRQMGFPVTVFEAHSAAGGMMRVGIPGFRHPEDILDAEIERITGEGVELILNHKITIRDIENDFSAVIVATGLHSGSRMNIPGEEHAVDGIRFLYEAKINHNNFNVKRGEEIAVIGGGNTAVDVARTLLRLGGNPTIFYRRTRNEMPAIPHEVDEAIAEGVRVELLSAPLKIDRNTAGLEIAVTRMKLGDPDSSGRRRPVPVEGSEIIIKAGKVISAIGQTSDNHFFSGNHLSVDEGRIEFRSKIPVFCCGDLSGGGTITEAVGSGNRVARQVNAILYGIPYTPDPVKNDMVMPNEMKFIYYRHSLRHPNPVIIKSDWHNDFSEVVQGLSEKETVAEAIRCLHCGDCYLCGNCFNYCPDAAIYLENGNKLHIHYDYCKGCGVCAYECPCGAIVMK
ncbi:MAG: 2-oxoacid:acceptor oxidoreductase family protein [Bacteroidetes bacterium]|nr:2-oxoacid:acceptor oxidoreductase family protein [Bacteroidota bacterium]